MSKRMLIDATHTEETRVVVVNGNVLEDFDIEFTARKQLKGNVYLAKVTRVEPSLQAAFVEYGGNRHGFLSFNEIHPDYYQIPVSDREKLVAEEESADDGEEGEDGENVEEVGGDEIEEEVERRRRPSYRGYKIQEVIKRRQILLVQVVKEERGNKGAALTTYLSLAGRYCVLMPNTNRGGGISRKISNPSDRKRLKAVLDYLKIPDGIGVIVRTAGAERSKAEIKRDYDYLMKQWIAIRELTLASTAPTLIYEEANLIKRSIRDLYSKQIDEILVEGEGGYRLAKDFMKTMIPSHAVRVKPYKDGGVPILHRYKVENQIDAIHHPIVQLKSGGYIVLNSTEALVAIDVNSGRATRGRNIEETAFKTNLEASEEIARQLRLRDLAGLVVIDFIDMEVSRNIHAVERKLKEALRSDRARIQVGRISHFGLLEMSRQRLRPSVMESAGEVCPTCGGAGQVRSTEATALYVLRALEEEGINKPSAQVELHVPTPVALYILNQKRTALTEIETRYKFSVTVSTDDSLIAPDYRLDRRAASTEDDASGASTDTPSADSDDSTENAPRKRRSRRRRSKRRDDEETTVAAADSADSDSEAETADADSGPADSGEEEPKRRRRRGRRGGRRRSQKSDAETEVTAESGEAETAEAATDSAAETGDSAAEETGDTPPAAEVPADASAESETEKEADGESKPKRPRRRRTRRKPAAKAEPAQETESAEAPAEAAPEESDDPGSAPEPAADETPEPAPAVEEPPTADEAPAEIEAPAPEPAAVEEPLPVAAGGAEPQEEEPEEDKPKRGGWWQRITR